jgi:hypothetical protein
MGGKTIVVCALVVIAGCMEMDDSVPEFEDEDGLALEEEGGELADEAAPDDADGEGDDFVPIAADYLRWCDCTGWIYTYGQGGGWVWPQINKGLYHWNAANCLRWCHDDVVVPSARQWCNGWDTVQLQGWARYPGWSGYHFNEVYTCGRF